MAAIIAAAGALSACATSNVSNGHVSSLAQPRFMTASQAATPPAGFIDFCARSPQDCGLTAATAPSIADAAVPAVARVAEASVAAGRPPRGGYDWRGVFAANPPQGAGDATAALRQQLYGRYMWKAAFAAAAQAEPRFEAPAAAPAQAEVEVEADTVAAPSMTAAAAPAYAAAPAITDMAAPSLQSASLYDAGVSRAIEGSLIKASYVSLSLPAPAAPAAPAAEAPAVVAPSMVAVAEPAAARVADAPRPLSLTPALKAQLTAVDRAINDRIIQTEDIRAYGQDDYWATPLEDGSLNRGRARGDCEDYALEKRRALVALGLPAEALAIAVADTRFGPHAVLLVNTDQGEVVLDSLTGKVVGWDKTGYRWVKRQAWGAPMNWVAIAN